MKKKLLAFALVGSIIVGGGANLTAKNNSDVVVKKKDKTIKTVTIKKKKYYYNYTYNYTKNKLVKKSMNVDYGNTGKTEVTKYKNGKKTYKLVTKFEMRENKLRTKGGVTAKTKYFYKKGKVSLRKTYKVNKKKKLVHVNTKKY